MEHKWLRNFDSAGNWTKSERVIRVNGVEHDLDEYAQKHGITLPDSQPQINITDRDYADMGKSFDEGDPQVDGDGDSEGSE